MTTITPGSGHESMLAAALGTCRTQLLDTQAPSPIQSLMVALDRIRANSSGGEWHRMVAHAREHPLFELLMQDPYTARAFQKPRGYAGDAVMLDYVYGRYGWSNDAGVTDLGMAIHAYSAGASPPARAVRWRRDWIASQIENSLAAAGRPIKVLSFACGHLREYEQVHPLLRDRACNWTAADQDLESLAHVRDSYDSRAVRCSETSVRALLRGSHDLDSACDLVYSLGLFDYLSGPVAARVMRALWKHVAPGGRLIVANFATDTPGAGYMEMFMDWWLTYRSNADLESCASDIPAGEIDTAESLSDPGKAVHYLVLTRGAGTPACRADTPVSAGERSSPRQTVPYRIMAVRLRRGAANHGLGSPLGTPFRRLLCASSRSQRPTESRLRAGLPAPQTSHSLVR